MSQTERPMDSYIDQALAALGSDDTEFYMVADIREGNAVVLLSCRYQGCEWGQYVGEMELWEFVADARQHWEAEHAPKMPPVTTATCESRNNTTEGQDDGQGR